MRVHLRRIVITLCCMVGALWLVLTLVPSVPDLGLENSHVMARQFLDGQHVMKQDDLLVERLDRHLPYQPASGVQGVKKKNLKKKNKKDIYNKVSRHPNKYNGEDYDMIDFPQYEHGQDKHLHIWPHPDREHDDRILDQMRYVPEAVRSVDPDSPDKFKVIYLPGGIGGDTPRGRKKFTDELCPVDTCRLTDSMLWRDKADVILFQNDFFYDRLKKRDGQLWILWLLESPFHTGTMESLKGQLNWTATYRADSTIVTPYEKFVHFSNFTGLPDKPVRNYAEGKKHLVAWFVSNCAAANKRWEYVQALRMYGIDVHIYGACGPHQCNRYEPGLCDKLLSTDYKFYLSFENSNCKHYITEKFYWNGLKNDVVPIVMGARKEDYKAAAPPHSYIHVEDFDSPKGLAEYLRKLDKDDDLYNQYFRWKGSGEFINTKFWCRLCSLVHDHSGVEQAYMNVEQWWRDKQTCVRDRWDADDPYIDDWNEALNGF